MRTEQGETVSFGDARSGEFQIVVATADACDARIGFQILLDFLAVLIDTVFVRIEIECHFLNPQVVIADELRQILHTRAGVQNIVL